MTTAPCVLNLRGRRGVLPEGAVYIGGPVYRGPWRLQGSKWANPFRPGRDGTREEVIAKYERWLHETGLIHDVHELRGKDLVCWCAPEACHGDLLLRLANA
jgi:hypothetical protein